MSKGSLKGSQGGGLDYSQHSQPSSGGPSYGHNPSTAYMRGASVDYDTDTEQQAPMMPHQGPGGGGYGLPPGGQVGNQPPGVVGGGPVGDQSQQPGGQQALFNMANENPAPTGTLAWAGFGCVVFGLACMAVAFASPYWMQTYPNSMNQFRNMGLWQVCMDHYMHHKDDSQTIYNGCWWVFDRAPQYWKLREWLLPPWFIAVQVMATGSLIVQIASLICIALVFLHFCPILNHEYYQTYAMFAGSAMQFLVAMMVVISAIMYGSMSQDWEWMPRPDRNFISWGYGFYIIAGMATVAAGILLFMEALRVYNELIYRDDEYNKAIMEMSMGPSLSGSYPPGAYPPGSYPPGYDSSYSGQPQYHSQSSYDKGGYDKSYEAQQRPY